MLSAVGFDRMLKEKTRVLAIDGRVRVVGPGESFGLGGGSPIATEILTDMLLQPKEKTPQHTESQQSQTYPFLSLDRQRLRDIVGQINQR